jgi:ComF family protein
MRLIDVLVPAAPPVCAACGAWAGAAEPLCGSCRRQLRWLSGDVSDGGVFAPVAYAGPARALVASLKFRGAVGVADAMAAAVCAAAPDGLLAGDVVLVPVPLHPSRRRRRGFNQAERLARAVGERCGLTVCDCLARGGSRGTQMGLGRGERLERIAGAVSVPRSIAVPERAVLVDDVVTTGATLAACAAALRDAGAREVRAVAYARTPGR